MIIVLPSSSAAAVATPLRVEQPGNAPAGRPKNGTRKEKGKNS
ncbi:hypothetical protein [Amycolatopsis benzoatilytica]|nr:hypothetical protein [Amycolatopsis benzoatilytica]